MTEESLDRILAQCLEEAEQSGDIEAVLRAHPEHADELRPLLEMATVARRLYADLPEPPGGLAWGRARVLSQARPAPRTSPAEERVAPRQERSFPKPPRLAAVLIGAGVAAAIAVFSLVSFVRAADGAIPGHPLYGADRALERIAGRLTGDAASAAQLRSRLAEERLREVAQLSRANDQAHLQEALQAYDDAVIALAQVSEAGRGTGDLAAVSVLDQVLASHEERLQAALEGPEGQGALGTGAGGEEVPSRGRWCREPQGTHPLAVALARRYEIDADAVRSWFCDDSYSFGEIMHALQTSALVSRMDGPSDATPAALLALRRDLGGWGQVWQALGLIGQPDRPEPPELIKASQPPGQTKTPQPPGQSKTPQPPGQSKTPQPPGQSKTPQPPGQSKTPQPPGQTKTPQPPGQSKTPQPPGQTRTPQPPGQTKTPQPPGQTKTPQPPGRSKTPQPPGQG